MKLKANKQLIRIIIAFLQLVSITVGVTGTLLSTIGAAAYIVKKQHWGSSALLMGILMLAMVPVLSLGVRQIKNKHWA